MRLRMVVVVLAILCAVFALGRISAQVIGVRPVPAKVMTGEDLGFQVEGLRGDTPVGRIVVKVNGRWVNAELATQPTLPLATR